MTPDLLERILKYLEQVGKPVPAAQVLLDALNIRSANELAAGKVLRAIVGRDPRFHILGGLWTAGPTRPDGPAPGTGRTATLFIEAGAQPGWARGAMYFPEDDQPCVFQTRGSLTPVVSRTVRSAAARTEGRLLLAWSPREHRLWNRLLRDVRIEGGQGDCLCLRDLAARVLEQGAHRLGPEDLAACLGLPAPDPEDPAAMARFFSSCFSQLLERAPEESRAGAAALRAWVESANPRVDFSRFGFAPQLLDGIPQSAGVYIMRNRAGDVVYVGKSRNLRRRVRSYFTPRALRDPKVRRIHELLHTVETVPTNSELEALILEMRLIRDFGPPVNLQAEVHEQPGTYGKDRNLLLLVPQEGGDRARIYFLREGSFVAQQSAPLGRRPSKSLLQKIRTVFYDRRSRRRRERQPWEIELVYRWLKANRRWLNCVDVDEAGGLDEVARRIAAYLTDPGKLTERVCYR